MLAAIALLAMSAPPQAGFDPTRLDAIPGHIKEFVDRGKNAGTVILVARNGRTVLFEAAGYANVETRQPMKKDTIFQIMSMTKPIVGILALLCAEEGRLNLDDPIEKFLPGFKNPKVKLPNGNLEDARIRPTIRHLLTHTAGFAGVDPGKLDDDQKMLLTLEEYSALQEKDPALTWQPGEGIHYAGPGFAALGRIVEIASGQKLQDYARAKIFDPLKMRDTFFFAPAEKQNRIAQIYMQNGVKQDRYRIDVTRPGAKYANPAGGLYSTAEDMGRLMTCLANNGKLDGYRLISPAGIDAMTSLQTGNLSMDGNEEQGYGLGFTVTRRPGATLKPTGTFGHTGAFGTEFWADRKRGIVAVFMSQGFDSDARKTFNTLVNAAFVGP